jgi:uncharacterized ion transporter superfamily protein YfcC
MKLKVPHTLVLLFMIMAVALIATYLLPQGMYEMTETESGRTVVEPGSYHALDKRTWLTPWELLTVIPRALEDAQGIVFFVFIIGGALAVIKSTGTIDAMLGKMLEKFGGRPQVLIVAGMLVFTVGSSTIGMAEEYLPFVPVLLALCVAMQMDAVAAVGMMVVGYGIGYGVAAVNPFTVMIAQDIAEVRPTSGIAYRLLLTAPFFAIGWHHVQSYAFKVRRDPSKSLLYDLRTQVKQPAEGYPPFRRIHTMVLGLTVAAIAAIVYGVSDLSGWHWYLEELSAVFLLLTIVVIIIARINPSAAAREFTIGASELTGTALLVGFARAIALILEDGMVLHTIVHYLSMPLQAVGPEISAVGMFFIQSLINFFIPSGSGQAFVTMPLMTPIADLTGVSRQIAVLAYQFGDGFTNMMVPTNAVLMGILGIAGVPYDRWFRFIIPLMIKIWIAGSLALVLAVWIGYV